MINRSPISALPDCNFLETYFKVDQSFDFFTRNAHGTDSILSPRGLALPGLSPPITERGTRTSSDGGIASPRGEP